MAALKLKEEASTRLTLEIALGQRLSNLFGLLIFTCVAISFLSSFLDESFGDNPVAVLMVLIFAFSGLRTAYSVFGGTTIDLDTTARLASRTTTFARIPFRRTELSLDRVRRVVVGSKLPVTLNLSPARMLWQVSLDSTEGAPFVVNSNGTYAEMLALGKKAAALLGRPLADEFAHAKDITKPAPEIQPIQDFGERRTSAPPVAVPMPFGQGRPILSLPEKELLPNTLTIDADTVSVEQEPYQTVPATVLPPLVDVGMPPIYSAMPAMELPDQPPLGETSNTPTAIPESVPAAQPAPTPTRPRTFAELQKAIADDPTDSVAFYQLARLLQSRRAVAQAESAYQSAARLDPLSAAVQNDWGVLYLQYGNFKEAEAKFRRAIGLDPFAALGYYNLGWVLTRTGRRTEAQQAFNRAQQNAANDDERQFCTGIQNSMMGEPLLTPQS